MDRAADRTIQGVLFFDYGIVRLALFHPKY